MDTYSLNTFTKALHAAKQEFARDGQLCGDAVSGNKVIYEGAFRLAHDRSNAHSGHFLAEAPLGPSLKEGSFQFLDKPEFANTDINPNVNKARVPVRDVSTYGDMNDHLESLMLHSGLKAELERRWQKELTLKFQRDKLLKEKLARQAAVSEAQRLASFSASTPLHTAAQYLGHSKASGGALSSAPAATFTMSGSGPLPAGVPILGAAQTAAPTAAKHAKTGIGASGTALDAAGLAAPVTANTASSTPSISSSLKKAQRNAEKPLIVGNSMRTCLYCHKTKIFEEEFYPTNRSKCKACICFAAAEKRNGKTKHFK